MLWNPGFLAALGSPVDVQRAMPIIAGPVFGFDMGLPNTIFADAAGTTLQTVDKAQIGRVNDAFGSALFVRQADTARQPILVRNSRGTLSCAWFSGATRYMSGAGATNPGTLFQYRSFTTIAVFRLNDTNWYEAIFSAGDSTGGAGAWGSDHISLECANGTGNPVLIRSSGTEDRRAVPAGAGISPNAVVKVVARGNIADGSMTVKVKGPAGVFTGTGALPTSTDSAIWDSLLVGSNQAFGPSQPIPQGLLSGDLFEWRFWGSFASDTVADALLAYADLKWGS